VSPPDPGKAAAANDPKLLRDRLLQCTAQRDRVPNVVALDFAVRAKIATTVRDVAEALRERVKENAPTPPASAPPSTTTPPTTVAPTAPPAEPIPQATVVTSLTGGDPTLFCTALVNAARVLTPWAYAQFSGTPPEQGEADLVYGPAVERVMTAYVASAPTELATLAKPLLARATAATGVLRQLGLDDDAIAARAEQAVQATAISNAPDGVTLQATMATAVAQQVGRDKLSTAAQSFRDAQGDPTDVSDLGYVPNDVAAASNFDCPAVTIG
jgi:hypothetical protein